VALQYAAARQGIAFGWDKTQNALIAGISAQCRKRKRRCDPSCSQESKKNFARGKKLLCPFRDLSQSAAWDANLDLDGVLEITDGWGRFR
jgi:hypothetical protein